jgi:hypothetical protein
MIEVGKRRFIYDPSFSRRMQADVSQIMRQALEQTRYWAVLFRTLAHCCSFYPISTIQLKEEPKVINIQRSYICLTTWYL